jgi:putative nucleotidyltransferase with HDIG domain
MAIQIDAEGIRKIFPEVDQIQDKTLREGVVEIWLELADETAWERFEDIPKNLTLEKHEPLIGHIQGVTRMALALAEVAEKIHGITVDGDLLIAACLLHDISKPLESEPDPGGQPSGGSILSARKTEFGSKIQHGVYGAHKIWEKDLPKAMELAHLVITHTRASNTRAASYEASLIFYADWADSDAGIITGGGRPFAARWIEEK